MAFTLSGILSLDNSKFKRGMNESIGASDVLSSRMKKTTGSLKGLVGAAAGMVGVGLTLKDTVSTFADFQKEMSNVQAITEETSMTQMKRLNEKAKEMGRILPASASDAATAMSNLGSAGFTTDEIMKSIEGTLYLATSAQTDMATAAEITSGTLRGFGLEAEKSGHVADVLARTAAKTNAGIIDMGESMKYAAPVSKAMGIELEETAAAIGLMANANIKGSQSGTTLRGALIRLTKPAKPAREAMEEMGFSAFDSAGNMNDLATIVGDLQKKTQGYTSEQKNAALATIFGQEALSGMLALVQAGPEQLSGLTTSLENADGAAKKMADTQTNNLYGAIQEVDGAFETMKINIMENENAAPKLTSALKGMAKVMPGLTEKGLDKMNDGFAWLKENKGEVLGAITGLTAAYGANAAIATALTVRTALLTTGTTANILVTGIAEAAQWGYMIALESGSVATGVLAGAQWALNAAMTANPIGLVVVSIGALTAGLVVAYNKVAWFKDIVDGLWGALKGAREEFNSRWGGVESQTQFAPKYAGIGVPKNANGSAYAGGLSMVNERGGEMQVLRNGTSIIPADRTKQMVEGNTNDGTKTQTIQIILDGKILSESVMDYFVPQLQLRLNNM